MKRRKIPGTKEWAGYEADLDARYARKLYFGKQISEVVGYFAGGRCIERSSELLYMPRGAFQYYIFAFVEYIRSEEAEGDSDAASVFLRLISGREKKDPGSVRAIYRELRADVEFVAANQAYYDASPHIYGSFTELGSQVRDLCEDADDQ